MLEQLCKLNEHLRYDTSHIAHIFLKKTKKQKYNFILNYYT